MNSPLIRIPVKYGAIAGLLGGLALIGLYYTGTHPLLVFIFLDFRIFLFGIFIYFTLRELRDGNRGGLLSFGEGMISSFIFVTVFGLLASAILWGFAESEPDFISDFVTKFKKQIKSFSEEDIKQIGKDNLQRNLEALSSTNGRWMAWNYLKQCYWIGLLISIILSVVLRRQPKT